MEVFDPGFPATHDYSTFNFITKKSRGIPSDTDGTLQKTFGNVFTLDLESIFGSTTNFSEEGKSIDSAFLDLEKLFLPQKSGYREANNLNLNLSGMKILPFLKKNLLWLVLLRNIPKNPDDIQY
ncbi:hypothetical protein TNIN_100161 [Trichonephila inaurata madagascariensis]|uniref:Uncharacterized protein n=1 Tax=Trichonephila inaurata madagascariensis TaxID=2747483 RepID=A0A8X7C8T3_9ARAC|nr:hypothetical protein TNIN_100161 [Trichonephila inaurata madagascariensis]